MEKQGIKQKVIKAGKIARNASLLLAVMVTPVLAQDRYADTEGTVCGFLDNINGLLSIASIAVVTIAIIFAGYQIAFAHKRISDVAPILIGGLLIGAAGQIASMIMPETRPAPPVRDRQHQHRSQPVRECVKTRCFAAAHAQRCSWAFRSCRSSPASARSCWSRSGAGIIS
jgi:TrbC/VIRB2 family.